MLYILPFLAKDSDTLEQAIKPWTDVREAYEWAHYMKNVNGKSVNVADRF